MAIPTVLFVLLGWLMGGKKGVVIALALASVMNLLVYFFGHEIILWHHEVVKLREGRHLKLYEVTRPLCQQAGTLMPGLYLFYTPQPNAFATGPSPGDSFLALSSGLLRNLQPDEVEGILYRLEPYMLFSEGLFTPLSPEFMLKSRTVFREFLAQTLAQQ